MSFSIYTSFTIWRHGFSTDNKTIRHAKRYGNIYNKYFLVFIINIYNPYNLKLQKYLQNKSYKYLQIFFKYFRNIVCCLGILINVQYDCKY